jgi:AAA+ ATPase superfamily predicted ATPase
MKKNKLFIGREAELKTLDDFRRRKTAGLAICKGRRRIGKSTLIQQFGKRFKNFYEFYGLVPREGITNQDQLNHFGELLGNRFGLPPQHFSHWNQALETLAQLTGTGRVMIFLDEISWMGCKDKDFAGKLKGVWDTGFKKNNRLLLILCGSVSSWIDKNILDDKGFLGRVSLTITLEELPIRDANKFWPGQKRVSAFEKYKLLSITGGVPRYLEEINPSQTAEQNIHRMCFSKEGFLFSEFNQIFKDIFGKNRAPIYIEIVRLLVNGPLEPKEIAGALDKKPTGGLSEILFHLTASGFVTREYTWRISGRQSAHSRYRLQDNYIRFYLKYIEPVRVRVEKGLYKNIHLENTKNWESIMGLQLENLVHANLHAIIKILEIPGESIINAGPYFQKQTQQQKACQIDLLIDTKYSVYLCEVKFRKKIGTEVIRDVEQKMERLQVPGIKSFRPVLIYMGELTEPVKQSDAFIQFIPLERLLIS